MSFLFKLHGEEIIPKTLEMYTSKFDLTMESVPNENGVRLRMEYNTGKMNSSMVTRMADSFILLLEQIAKIG